MDPMTIALLAGGLLGAWQGSEKNKASSKAAEEQRKIEAVKAKWYGWNKEAPQVITTPSAVQDILQGGLQGAQVGNLIMGAYGKPTVDNARAVNTTQAQTQNLPTLQQPSGILSTPANQGMPTQLKNTPSVFPSLQRPRGPLSSVAPTDIQQTAWWKLLPQEDKQAILGS